MIVGNVAAGWLISVGEIQLMYWMSALFTVGGIFLALCFLGKDKMIKLNVIPSFRILVL